MMLYCDLHFQSVDRRGCPWCRIEEIEEAMNTKTLEHNKCREALERIVGVAESDIIVCEPNVFDIAREALREVKP